MTRLEIISSEPYSIMDGSIDSPQYGIQLDRLAPGAQIELIHWTRQLVLSYDPPSTRPINATASFNGGIAEPRETATALEEVENLADWLLLGTNAILNQLVTKLKIEETEKITEQVLKSIGIIYEQGSFVPTGESRAACNHGSACVVWSLDPAETRKVGRLHHGISDRHVPVAIRDISNEYYLASHIYAAGNSSPPDNSKQSRDDNPQFVYGF